TWCWARARCAAEATHGRGPAPRSTASGPVRAYRDALLGFPAVWGTALQDALSGYFENGTQTLDLSALPRCCLFAARDVLHAFLQACDALDRPPLALRLPPALRRMPEWVNKCPWLRSIDAPRFAGRSLDFTGLPHLGE